MGVRAPKVFADLSKNRLDTATLVRVMVGITLFSAACTGLGDVITATRVPVRQWTLELPHFSGMHARIRCRIRIAAPELTRPRMGPARHLPIKSARHPTSRVTRAKAALAAVAG